MTPDILQYLKNGQLCFMVYGSPSFNFPVNLDEE